MSTPLHESEPAAFGWDARDDLLTIQGKVPPEVTTRRKMQADVLEHFSDVSARPASGQAKYYVNAFYDEMAAGQAERIYNEWKIFKIVQKEASSSDSKVQEDGSAIPSALAQLFLQRLKRTMTAEQFKAEFRNIDTNYDGKMSFLEYLCWDHKKSPASVIYRPQFSDPKMLLNKKIKNVVAVQKELRDYYDELKRLEEGSLLPGVKGKNFTQQLAQFKVNVSLDGINARLATAMEAVIKTRSSLKYMGDQFWADRQEADRLADQPQRKQANQ